METMEPEQIKNVRLYAVRKFDEILDGKFDFPKYQCMDKIDTKCLSHDIDTQDFVDEGLFGISGIWDEDLVLLIETIELLHEKLENAKVKYSENDQVKELKNILKIVGEKIEKLKTKLNS